jgi:hypothetical protein
MGQTGGAEEFMRDRAGSGNLPTKATKALALCRCPQKRATGSMHAPLATTSRLGLKAVRRTRDALEETAKSTDQFAPVMAVESRSSQYRCQVRRDRSSIGRPQLSTGPSCESGLRLGTTGEASGSRLVSMV